MADISLQHSGAPQGAEGRFEEKENPPASSTQERNPYASICAPKPFGGLDDQSWPTLAPVEPMDSAHDWRHSFCSSGIAAPRRAPRRRGWPPRPLSPEATPFPPAATRGVRWLPQAQAAAVKA